MALFLRSKSLTTSPAPLSLASISAPCWLYMSLVPYPKSCNHSKIAWIHIATWFFIKKHAMTVESLDLMYKHMFFQAGTWRHHSKINKIEMFSLKNNQNQTKPIFPCGNPYFLVFPQLRCGVLSCNLCFEKKAWQNMNPPPTSTTLL